ncbi:unnamed protein product [Cyprideis torosa]|uniref:phosphate acyltransferase n=1 Tax=Cyprideis torosa TaxID=163714 RepID=A0A7R8WIV3_9CRUS|nr:unnamed protein product [Cyprideis torosa]CAG0899264.1 unnamed protein product [Cyprideis torosa]
MALPKRRHSRSRTRKRRSHDALNAPVLATCSNCGEPKESHRLCGSCGSTVRIALDAMGGDNGSDDLITGAVAAVKSSGVGVVLVGDEDLISPSARRIEAECGLQTSLEIPVVLMDIGANVDCKPLHLLQFAVMAAAFSSLDGRKRPRVGLLSIGEEIGKGNSLVREAYGLLKDSSLNFIGNVEGRDVYRGDVDVIVCDGFVGNNILKTSEGLAEALMVMLAREIEKSRLAKLGYLLARPAFRCFKKRVDYTEYGGAPLLGINGTGIVCHGSSNANAIKNAIQEAVKMVDNKVIEKIAMDLARNKPDAEDL